ncbi:MAG: TldD/PmbA family protein [Anaerolineae bacterium]|nr:TldD/PmbA family protein [Anaerolineae bacterium]
MRDRIEAALKSSKADYTEIRIEQRDATTVAFRGKNLETASAVVDTGGIVRCLCRNNGWGVVTFNTLDDLPARVEQAYQCARAAHSEQPIDLVPISAVQEQITASLDAKHDFRGLSMAEKKALAESYNNIMLTFSDKIVDTQAYYGDSFTRLILATSDGTFIEEERPMVSVVAAAVARDGDNVQSAHETRSGQHGFDFVQGCEHLARTAAQRAVDLLNAQTVVGGQYPVVIDPVLAGVFIHEAFGHLSESDFVYENPKAKEMMVMGRRFGQDFLTVFDDGSIPGLRGTHRYDDEGTPTRRNDLIKNGVLVGRLHSRETAAKMGEPITGNARAINYRHPPIVRMTNTAIEAGTTSFEEMIKGIKLGIYACDAYGGNTALENFSFSSGYAYMIRDGQIAEMVKDVILAGNLFATLLNIDAVGNDFQWIHHAGGCGKGGQFPLPVAFGAPHVRIQDVVIGGK